MNMYLNCHTYYSLRYGTISPKALVEAAKDRGIKALALTDINNTSCTYEFITSCKKHKIKPVVGIEFRKDHQLLYIGIAKNQEGFRALNKLLTDCSINKTPLPDTSPNMPNTYIIYPKMVKPIELFEENEFLGIRPEHIHRLFSGKVLKYRKKLVVLSPVTFLDKDGYTVHKLLRAIDLNIVYTKLAAKDCAKATEFFTPPEVIENIYKLYPFILRNTQQLLHNCSIELKSHVSNNLQIFTKSKIEDYQLLKKLAEKGLEKRYTSNKIEAKERLDKELKIIERKEYCSYFLITWDIIQYAKNTGYHYVGRGSGANSIVAYCLYITDIDPIELDLYFERFINIHRKSLPDFDIDFCWDERDDVIDYIFKRYGREHTALLATYTSFKGKSIYRELGKVFGLPKREIDTIIDYPERMDKHEDIIKQLIHYGQLIKGFPNYLSIHAGGIIISEKPINYFTALQMMPKGFPITHFNMYHAEDMKFHKFDILSQRGLGHIKDAVDLIKVNQDKVVDIHQVDQIMQDKKVKDKLQSAQCMGCFYIESPAMRGLLSKLRCNSYKHLVAASSIIRPGVAQSGMMRAYIWRFHHPYAVKYLHPIFKEQLSDTYGIMVYQEDVIKIVHHFADLGLDESDVLRRIMSGKKAKEGTFERLKEKYFDNCKARGYSKSLTNEVWRQISSFAGYSFCKAHSASYAIESFQSLYLKTYYPLEFMVAVINNFGGFYQTEYYFHEAKMSGATIHAPCINKSNYRTSIEGTDIYIGFIHIQQMERTIAKDIILQRRKHGPFRNIEDFVNRVNISTDQLDILIRINAFRFTGKGKYELMWEKISVFNPKEKFEATSLLFQDTSEEYSLPKLEEGSHDQSFDEIELLGFPLCSPFELLENQDILNNCYNVIHLKTKLGQLIQILGYYVCKKNVYTKNNDLMNFGTWIDSDGRFFDTTHFPNALKNAPFRGKGIYKITGKVVEEFGFLSIEVSKMEKLAFVRDSRY